MNGTMLEFPRPVFREGANLDPKNYTLFKLNVVVLAQAEYSYFSADLRMKIFL